MSQGVFFGTGEFHEYLGKVAEYCPKCERVRAFYIMNQFGYFNFWIDKGRFRNRTSLVCKKCNAARPYSAADYIGIAPPFEEIYLDDLIIGTNPQVNSLRGKQRQVNEAPSDAIKVSAPTSILALEGQRSATETDNAQPPMPQLAIDDVRNLQAKIEPYSDNGRAYERLAWKLDLWPMLSLDDRAKLSRRVNTFVLRRRIEEMLFEISRNYPIRPISMVQLTILVVLLISGIVAGVVLLDSQKWHKDILIVLGIIPFYALGILVICWHEGGRRQRLNWIRKRLIPQASLRQIELQDIVDWMTEQPHFGALETPGITMFRSEIWMMDQFITKQDQPPT